MIKHFETIRTPLQSIHIYPSIADQKYRFESAGWFSVEARSLWDLWSDDRFIAARDRCSINSFEPFDEWEEFALFASHYFLLVASNSMTVKAHEAYIEASNLTHWGDSNELCLGVSQSASDATYSVYTEYNRKYSVAFESQLGVISQYGGYGDSNRLQTYMDSAMNGIVPEPGSPLPSAMSHRVCHTATTFLFRPTAEFFRNTLVTGGRISPDRALAECWFLRQQGWDRVEDLPVPLYRHSAIAVLDDHGSEAVLIYGGRSTNGVIMNDWLLWYNSTGWTIMKSAHDHLSARFGAVLISDGSGHGLLLGGMGEDGTVFQDIWEWSIDFETQCLNVKLHTLPHESPLTERAIHRFGASATRGPTSHFLSGGIIQGELLPVDYDVVELLIGSPAIVKPVSLQVPHAPIPLLIGHSSLFTNEGLQIVGGGALCFSFGPFWNDGIWSKQPGYPTQHHQYSRQTHSAHEESPLGRPNSTLATRIVGMNTARKAPIAVARSQDITAGTFERIIHRAQPVVLEGFQLGSCTKTWTAEYLKRVLGSDLPVQLTILVHLEPLLILYL